MVLLIVGGSGSGKSEYAEMRAVELSKKAQGKLYYIATMEPFDEESMKRIERHRNMRKEKNFTTIECQTHLEKVEIPKDSTVLLECVSNLTANEMYGEKGRKEKAAKKILDGMQRLIKKTKNLVIVGNNVFDDGMCYDESTMEYIENIAWIQKQIANQSEEVIEVVHGIPIYSKGEKR